MSTATTPIPTSDAQATIVAEQAFNVARVARQAHGHTDLPEWHLLPPLKQSYFVKATRAALDGRPVWEVWAFSCGALPDDATKDLWLKKHTSLQFLPTVFYEFARAVNNAEPVAPNILSDEVDEVPADTPSDLPPEPGPVEEALDEEIEEIEEAIADEPTAPESDEDE